MDSAQKMDDETNLKTTEQLQLLRAHKAEIVVDLDVNRIIPFLLEQLVLSHDDKQRIEHEVTFEDKSNKLLNILETKATSEPDLGQEVILIFIESLKKDYDWLYKILTETDVPDSSKSKTFNHASDEDDNIFESPKHHKVKTMLEAGGVSCPLVSVERKDLVEAVRHELKHLKRAQFLVIQGMAGCGKSILAQQALNSAVLIKNMFPDGVFMLSIGKECSDSKDAIMGKMRILCEKLDETRPPISLEHGAELLRAAFLKRKKALLVLDGVWRSEVIRSLDVGCATMVTTRDISIMDVVHGRAKLLRIDSGFTESESLELFRRTLNFERIEDLPPAATSIHHTSKGSPMVVSLISSLFQDHPDEISDEGRWSYYLESLSKRRYSKIRRNREYEHESIYDAISLSVDSLVEKKRIYFYDFSIFQDDVPVPCPVFEVLWSLERYEVEDIMKHFVKKSLISEDLHPSRNWHVYSINSLQLDYLKHQLQCESSDYDVGDAERKLHDRLVTQYLLKCEFKYDKLPDDDYIYFYLGYHLYKSRTFSLFPQIYLDLLFIGEKLRLSGPADLLSDLRKYKDFIIGDSDERMKLCDEIQGFTELIGYVKYGQEDVDIVQLALQNPSFVLLHEKARALALSEPSRLYFEWVGVDPRQWKNPESSTVCSDGVRCIKFVWSTGNYFLAGLNDGTIELCDLNACGVIWRFSGHTDTVHCLSTYESTSISNNDRNSKSSNLIFLSASEDESCKVWTTLGKIIETEGHNSTRCYRQHNCFENNSPSPKIRNSKWTFEKIEDGSSFTFQFHTAPVMCAEFSHSGKEVVSASANEILVWNTIDGQVLYKNSPSSAMGLSMTTSCDTLSPFLSCHFGPTEKNDKIPYLLLGTGNQLTLYSLHHSAFSASIEASNMQIVSVLFFASDWICTVSENDIGLWKVEKGESQSIPRRKSLSPMRSFPLSPFPNGALQRKTEVDAKNIDWRGGGSNSGQFLLPLKKIEKISNEENFTLPIPRPSPSKYSLSPSTLSATIDSGEHFVRIVREHIIPKRTSGLFQCAAITQNHKELLLACGTSNMKICLFNLFTKEFLAEFNTHTGLLRCLDFSKVDEWTLLSGSEDQTVMVWDVKEEIAGRKISQKRSQFASVFIESAVWNESGYFLSVFPTDVNTIQFYRDSVLLHETSKMQSEISVVCLSPCGSYVTFGSECGTIYRLQRLDKCLQNTIVLPELIGDLDSSVELLKYDTNSEFLVAISSYGVVLILKNFITHHQLQLNSRFVIGVHFPFHKYVVFVCGHNNGSIVVLDLETRIVMKGLDGGLPHVTSSAMKHDSSCLAIGTRDDGIILCSLRFGVGVHRTTVITSKHKSAIRSLAFSPDSSKLAVGYKNGLITIWSISASSYTEEQNLVLHKSSVRHLLFSPFEIGERRWLVSCGDRLAVWSVERPVEQLPKTSFMAERRRRKSGDSRPSSRLSLELPTGLKIGKQGKRELLNSFSFRGNYAQQVVSDTTFTQFLTVDDTGIFYLLKIMKQID